MGARSASTILNWDLGASKASTSSILDRLGGRAIRTSGFMAECNQLKCDFSCRIGWPYVYIYIYVYIHI